MQSQLRSNPRDTQHNASHSRHNFHTAQSVVGTNQNPGTSQKHTLHRRSSYCGSVHNALFQESNSCGLARNRHCTQCNPMCLSCTLCSVQLLSDRRCLPRTSHLRTRCTQIGCYSLCNAQLLHGKSDCQAGSHGCSQYSPRKLYCTLCSVRFLRDKHCPLTANCPRSQHSKRTQDHR